MAHVIRYVDPDATGVGNGTNWANAYTSLAAWNAAEATDLVSAGNYHTVYCRSSGGTPDTAECIVSGWTTDADHYIEICASDFPTDGIWDDTAYVLHNNNAHDYALKVAGTAINVHNLQIKVTMTYPPSVQRYGVYLNPTLNGTIHGYNLLIKGVTTAVGSYAYGTGLMAAPGDTTATVECWNCVVSGFTNNLAGYRSYGIRSYGTAAATQVVNFYNCTSHGNYGGFYRSGTQETTRCINCISGNNTDDFIGAFDTIDYCCSDDGDGSHAQGPLSGNWVNELTNAAGWDFSLIEGGNCIENGTDAPGGALYTNDILGITRSSPWDIGAFEYGSGVWQIVMSLAATSDMSITLHSVNFAPIVGKWTFPVTERIGFLTQIIQSHDRTEQRIAHRVDVLGNAIPTNSFITRIVVVGDAAISKFEAALHRWLKRTWPVPVWPQAQLHTVNLPAGSGAISIDTRYADYRADGYAIIWQSEDAYEIVTVASIADSALTLDGTTTGGYVGNKWVMPCRLGWCLGAVSVERMPGGALYDITFEVAPGDLTSVTGFSEDLIYESMTVITTPSKLLGDSWSASHDPDIAVLGGNTGPFTVVSNSDFNEATQMHVWTAATLAEAWSLRQFLHDIRGRQKAFLVPTFRRDFDLTRPVGSGDTSLYVVNRGYARNMGVNAMRTYLALRPATGSLVVRKITGMSVVSDAEEKIDLGASAGQAFALGTLVCWVDKCRMADDEIVFEWAGRGRLICETQLVRVP